MWKRFRSRKRAVLNEESAASPSPHPSCVQNSSSCPRIAVEPPEEETQEKPSLLYRGLKRATDRPGLARLASAVSEVHSQLFSPHSHQQSQDRTDDPLGLVVLHNPSERTVDILFIHGLGGSSLRTWCRDGDLDKLWPKLWLPQLVPTARILSFGYKTCFSSKADTSSRSIKNFAGDLLHQMKDGETTTERLGQVPIIIVAHSMGGLVLKKALVQGYENDQFAELVSMMKGVLFLATPHRGNRAKPRSRLLFHSIFGHSPNDYAMELTRGSPTIDDLSDLFRHHASTLQIFSFYETLAASRGLLSRMIIDKRTAVLGYYNETPVPLNADHHNVCHLLGVTGIQEEDLLRARSMRTQGTCEGFFTSEEVVAWLKSDASQILWVNAQPGGGKSIMCSFAIERLLEMGEHCSYYFFKHGERMKQSVSHMVRSIAYQTALQVPDHRSALAELGKAGVRLSNADASTVWERLVMKVFAKIKTTKPVYWVFDGLDESGSAGNVVELLSCVSEFISRVRILVFSRPLAVISHAFQLARQAIEVVEMTLPDTQADVRRVVAKVIDNMPSGEGFKSKAVDEIMSRSQGNFLWATLATKRVVQCLHEDGIRQALESIPDGMWGLYDRMTDVVLSLQRHIDKELSEILLIWAMYARTPILVQDLVELYPKQFGSMLHISHAIYQVCGQFVVVNAQGQLALVHHSAREYLWRTKRLPFRLDAASGNHELFKRCMATLCDMGLRRTLKMPNIPRFVSYAATSWATHLEHCSPEADDVLDSLVKFFSGPYPLAWIQYLAMTGRVSELFGVSKRLSAYLNKRRKADDNKSPMVDRRIHLPVLDTWTVDLMKLPAKFGRPLSESPTVIYHCIPALSPTSSIIHQKFSKNPVATLSVSGISNDEWDDCIARVSGGSGRALRLATSKVHLAVASDEPRGAINVWNTGILEEQKTLCLDEHIWALAFSHSGALMAAYAVSKTLLWKVKDWSLLASVPNPDQERAIEFKFKDNDNLAMVSESRRVYQLSPQDGASSVAWVQMNPALLQGPQIFCSPSSVVFDTNCTKMAVAYLSAPLSIWTVDPPKMIAQFNRKSKPGQGPGNSDTLDNKVVWHPSGTEVIGICGRVYKWNYVTDKYSEIQDDTSAVPNGISCNPDGRVFVTTDVEGSLKIYDFGSMSLLYKLKSKDRINQIAFAPDGLRLYDLRGSYCTIWEPNCLLRSADPEEEQTSDVDSIVDDFWSDTGDIPRTPISLPASESQVESRPAITSIDCGRTPVGFLIAHTNDDGSINIFDTVSNRKHEVDKAMPRRKVGHLCWDDTQDRLAYSVVNGGVVVMSVRLEYEDDRAVSAETSYAEKQASTQRGQTTQLLFDTSGSRLLICGVKMCQILSIPDGRVVTECQSPGAEEPTKWQQHPSRPDRLLRLSASLVTTHSWDDLEPEDQIPLGLAGTVPDPVTDSEDSSTALDVILDSHSLRHLLLRTSVVRQNRQHFGFAILPTTSMCAQTTGSTDSWPPTAIQSQPISPTVSEAVAYPLGILPDGRFLFLDRQLWVCTSLLPHSPGDPGLLSTKDAATITRHFFIPQDWVTAEGLRCCRVLRDGTLLCPRKGEVAVLKGKLEEDGE
ncbi:hypothetical protein B0J18DRAFT_290678 [Chaetomium sp. MPI-SDFR-AT-0129]|nr:hypothetical protein B0J18DRAFT_290678 [Chaetomium sp. MPI-SDFR-AT-0129]